MDQQWLQLEPPTYVDGNLRGTLIAGVDRAMLQLRAPHGRVEYRCGRATILKPGGSRVCDTICHLRADVASLAQASFEIGIRCCDRLIGSLLPIADRHSTHQISTHRLTAHLKADLLRMFSAQ